MNFINIALGILLLSLAIEDFRKKKIMVLPVAAAFLLGILHLAINDSLELKSAIGGAGIGVILCILSWVTKKQIGLGDGLVTAVMGIYMGMKFTLLSLCMAFFLVSPTALILCCLKKVKKKDRLPFIPFLFLGYVITVWMKGVETV